MSGRQLYPSEVWYDSYTEYIRPITSFVPVLSQTMETPMRLERLENVLVQQIGPVEPEPEDAWLNDVGPSSRPEPQKENDEKEAPSPQNRAHRSSIVIVSGRFCFVSVSKSGRNSTRSQVRRLLANPQRLSWYASAVLSYYVQILPLPARCAILRKPSSFYKV